MTMAGARAAGGKVVGAEAGQTFTGLVWPDEEKASGGFQQMTGPNLHFEASVAAE